MTEDRWEQIIGHIKDNFDLIDHRTEDIAEDSGGTIEIVEFNGPLGKMKLERTTQPLVIDKRTIGSRRIGSDTTVEYVYSDTEKVHKFTVYRWEDSTDSWTKMEMKRDNMIF